jgi:uncharacterized protein (TIGR02996 family)
MFTTEDRAFIRGILSNPGELSAWLVYADWLDEHDNPLQAEFLRLMARRGLLSNTELEWYTVEARLEELRGTLDAVWVEVFDRPKIENCAPAFKFQCPKQWESLTVTGDPTVRHCGACDKDVHYCHTLPDAQQHARQGHCVAIQLGVPRHPDDLRPPPGDELTGERPDPYGGDIIGMMTWSDEPEPPPPRRPWWKFW